MDSKIARLRILSTIPIHSVNNSTKLPEEFGSGCFVHYKDNLLFFTVQHNFEKTNLVQSILVDYDDITGISVLEPLNDMSFFVLGNLKVDEMGNISSDESDCDVVDFALKKMTQLVPCKLLVGEDGKGVTKRIDRYVILSNLDAMPNTFENYGFAGLVFSELVNSAFVNEKNLILKQHPVFFNSLKYKYSSGNYHVFSMKNNDYESGDFKGTSGAPIIDDHGNLVSLVARGALLADDSEWFIYGVNLSKFKFAVDIECAIV